MTEILNKILLVEDEPDIQEIARLSLETLAHLSVQVCNSGKEALEQAGIFKPDLILLDVMMPGMDGLTTIKHLKADPLLTNIPVIFMTAKTQASEMKNYINFGAIGAISKPFDPMKLAEEIRNIWEDSK